MDIIKMRKTSWIRVAVAIVTFFLIIVIAQTADSGGAAYAAESGKMGTCSWTLDDNGVLTIGAGTYYYDDEGGNEPWHWYQDEIKQVRTTGTVKFFDGASLELFFEKYKNLEYADLSGFDTSGVVDMAYMFEDCYALKTVKLGGKFNTKNVTDMKSMFLGCQSLRSLDLNSFDTGKVKDMQALLYGCTSLESVNLSSFNTSNVTTMYDMFAGCEKLKTLDLSNFNTNSLTDMSGMFRDCASLTSINLKSFNTSKVKDMSRLFDGCTSLKKIDLSSFDTSAVENMDFMFYVYPGKLEEIKLGKWSTKSVKNGQYATFQNDMINKATGKKYPGYLNIPNVANVTYVIAQDKQTGTGSTAPKSSTSTTAKAKQTSTGGTTPKSSTSASTRTKQTGKDGTALGSGASAEAAGKAITAFSGDEGPKGSRFAPLSLRSTSQGKNNIKLTWNKVKGAKKYVVYGNACGKKNKMKKLATIAGTKKAYNVKKITKKLKKGTYHKFLVVALDKNNNVLSSSKVIHVATKGGKVGNNKSISVSKKAIANAKKLKKGKTLKLNAKAVAASKKLKVKKHRAVAYESTNTKIATVTKSGVVKGVKKGKCKIYAYSQDGICKTINVTIK